MNKRIVVAVDAMGGDNAPFVEVEGAVQAARQWQIPIVLVGDSARIEDELKKHDTTGLDLTIRHASEVVGMHDSASDAVRKKKDSSIRVAFNLVKTGEADAVVSAGNSGATMAAGMFVLKRIRGIDRPAIATIVPNLNDHTLVLDVGGNVDCKPMHLAQFALMGDLYARHLLSKASPRIGVLSNGEEEKKGTDLTRGAHKLLKNSGLNYIGPVEGRDVYNGNVDVVVCDGFVGNVLLKVSEGLAEAILRLLKREIQGRFWAKVGFLLAKPAFRAFRKKVDYAEVGGAPLLGIDGTGIICHGGSSPRAVTNAIRHARDYVEKQVTAKMFAQIQDMPLEDEAESVSGDAAKSTVASNGLPG